MFPFKKREERFEPWTEDEDFLPIISAIQDRRIYTRRHLYNLYQMARLAPEGMGAEVGTYKGASAYLLSKVLKGPLHVFDTFEGMPSSSEKDTHKKGDFADVGDAIGFLEKNEINVHKGFFPETAVHGEYSFVNIDVDVYQSVRDCLEYFVPRLKNGGIIICDDYGEPTCKGAKEAWDEYFTNKPFLYIDGQAVYFNL